MIKSIRANLRVLQVRYPAENACMNTALRTPRGDVAHAGRVCRVAPRSAQSAAASAAAAKPSARTRAPARAPAGHDVVEQPAGRAPGERPAAHRRPGDHREDQEARAPRLAWCGACAADALFVARPSTAAAHAVPRRGARPDDPQILAEFPMNAHARTWLPYMQSGCIPVGASLRILPTIFLSICPCLVPFAHRCLR